MNHSEFLNVVGNYFKERNYSVDFEVPLSNGKGAVDVFAYNSFEKIYAEIKSSPASLKQKKVKRQLEKYANEFGRNNKYVLISPDAKGNIKMNFQQ
jgi:hypothetical protein